VSRPGGMRGWAWWFGAAIAVLVTLAFTDPYGTQNQVTYLLDPLHRVLPELYRRDWFVSETPAYLPSWGWLAAWLYRIDPEGPAVMLTAHVAVTLATYAGVGWLVTALSRDARGFAIVVAVCAATMVRTLGGNYLLAGYLQPSTVASAGWVVAMAALVRRRYGLCGVVLALAGLLHINFLVLGIGLFPLAALARRDATRSELARLVVPQLVVLMYSLPDLLGATGASAEAVRIFIEFHAPGHYAAGRLARHLPELACWELAAFAVLPLLDAAAREARALWRFSLVAFAVTVATTAMVAVPALQSLTQVRWSRIAPFGQLACHILVVSAMLGYATTATAVSRRRRGAAAAAIALAILGTCRFLRCEPAITLAAAAGPLVIFGVPRRMASVAVTLATASVVAVVLWRSPRGAGLTTQPIGQPSELALESWARRDTPIDALFLTSPDLPRFRLLARRAIVVDTKSPPLRPDLLVAWYHRLCAVVQVRDAATHEWVEQRFPQLAPAQLAAVARSFGADYIVVGAATQLSGERVYGNAEYAVYRTPLANQ